MEFVLGAGLCSHDLAEAVEDNGERAFCHLAGIEQLERSCGGVAGIGKEGLAGLFACAVQGGEGRLGKIDFSAELDDLGQPVHGKGQVPDRLEVFRDVVALLAVPSGEALGQAAVFVTHADGDAVHLGLDGEVGGLPVQVFGDTVEKLLQLPLAVSIIETLHRHGVAHRAEGVERGAADFFCGGIFVGQVRMGFFQVLEFPVKAVIGGIGNFRAGLHIIKVIVAADFPEKLLISPGGFLLHRRKARPSARPMPIPTTSASQSAMDTCRPGERRWTCSSRAPQSAPTAARAGAGAGRGASRKPSPP